MKIRLKIALFLFIFSVSAAFAQEESQMTVRQYLDRAAERISKGSITKAIEDYNRALELDSSSADVYFRRGIAFEISREREQAIADFTAAIERRPQFTDAYFHRANLNSSFKEYPAAIADINKIIEIARGAFAAASVKRGRHGNTFEQVMLENFANYVDCQQNVSLGRDRDEEMFRNVLWYSKRLPRRKIIIWTATVHAARRQIKPTQLPLGVRLADRWSNRLAVIGFTAYTGESSIAGHPAKLLPEAPPDSLEARATNGNKDLVLLDSPSLKRFGAISSRLMGDFTTSDWSKSFDLVLVIRRETAPMFEQQK